MSRLPFAWVCTLPVRGRYDRTQQLPGHHPPPTVKGTLPTRTCRARVWGREESGSSREEVDVTCVCRSRDPGKSACRRRSQQRLVVKAPQQGPTTRQDSADWPAL